jgi:hypothetical protein
MQADPRYRVDVRLGLLAAAAVAALAAAVPAGGAPQKQVGFSPARVLANGATYVDPQGDSDFVPDIVLVGVSNDNAGTVTFEVGFTNRPDGLTADDVIQIRIDSDGAFYTGRNGFETMLQVSAYGLEVLKDADGDYALTDTPVRGVFSGGLLTLQMSIRDLADTASIRFYVAADSLSSSPGIYDWAPDGDSLFRYIVDVPLLLDAWQTVQPKAGTTAVLTGAFTTNDAVPGTVTCAATLLGKRIAGTGRWTTATVLPAVPPSPDIARPGPYAYKATAGCSFKLPKTARRKTLKGTITVSKDGVVVRRAFSYRVR